MTTKKKTTDHKPAVSEPLPEGMLGTKEAAEHLKITPRKLRVILRSLGKGTGGERYMWKDADLPKLTALVHKYEEDQKADEKK